MMFEDEASRSIKDYMMPNCQIRIFDDDGNEMDLKQMEQEELKEETTSDLSNQPYVADLQDSSLTIKDELEEEIPEAATVGFDDMGSDYE